MATELFDIYRCPVCGNMVEVIHPAAGELVCCGKPMIRLKENSVDAAREKHVPVIELKNHGIVVKVGEVPHPSTTEHFIEWIEVIDAGRVYRQHLKPGAEPQAFFECSSKPGLIVRAYCNLHGLWRK